MKKLFLFACLLFTMSLNAKICTSGCAFQYGNSTVGYGYAWSVGNGELCTSSAPPGTTVHYAIAMGSNNNNITIIDAGTTKYPRC